MSIETEISSLTTAIRNLTDALLASRPIFTTADYTLIGAQTGRHSVPTPEPVTMTYTPEVAKQAAEVVEALTAPAPEPKKAVKKEAAPAPSPEPTPAPDTEAPAPAPTVSEDELRVQIVELARPNMGDAAFKAFLGGKLTELQGAPCSISGTGKLPKIDAKHLPTLLAAINKQLGK